MKTLVVYYSRSNVTRKIAEMIREKLDCDIEEITDAGKYGGKIGYMKGGFDATTGKTTKINEITKNPSDYDLVIVGTPIWASNMATPVYSYLIKYSDQINDIAPFCTCISGGYEKTLEKIKEITKKQPKSEMYLTRKDIKNPIEKINNFIEKI
ncbi:flavodoxin family protein [Methanobrevibacter oralis]|uniref:Flavodoxin n=1 Tax=Methanobrevibacter oralis TaxID=66851 RepID=A0A166ARL5_METOA|nr:flavodoxin [Methanobrevibacter oralis]KZX12384.1 flavodoxin [Methanobrevibacter oralis]